MLALAMALAVAGCGGGDNGGDASATTKPPSSGPTTTAGVAGGPAGDRCPVDADDVSSAVGADVVDSSAVAEIGITNPDVDAALDVLCGFSADGTVSAVPIVLALGSDDARAESSAMSDLGANPTPVDGIGDGAFSNGTGDIVFHVGSTWYYVTVATADPAVQDAAAQAVARLLAA